MWKRVIYHFPKIIVGLGEIDYVEKQRKNKTSNHCGNPAGDYPAQRGDYQVQKIF